MTRDEAQTAYDTARLRFADACMTDPPDREAWDDAKDELTRAARNLRGYPRTLYGTSTTEGAA